MLLYLTRWVTHLCAPTFVFLAGTSAWLQRTHGKPPGELARFLATRGLWLIALELTVIGFAWSFSLPYLIFLQVIWAIGAALVALAALVWLPRAALLALGIVIVAGHDLLDGVPGPAGGLPAALWTALVAPGPIRHAGELLAFVPYPALPWLGVLLLGYGLAPWFLLPQPVRDRRFPALGLALLALFGVLRGANLYGTPQHWALQPTLTQTLMDVMRVEKYPPSLLYVCATLGLVFLAMPLIDRAGGALARVLLVFGAVPLFAYVLHLYLAHALAIVLRLATGQSTAGLHDLVRNVFFHPERLQGSGFALGLVYLAWLALLLALYPLCRWYADLRRRRRDWWWLSYL